MPSLFTCSPLIHEWLCKKTQVEKKRYFHELVKLINVAMLKNKCGSYFSKHIHQLLK